MPKEDIFHEYFDWLLYMYMSIEENILIVARASSPIVNILILIDVEPDANVWYN